VFRHAGTGRRCAGGTHPWQQVPNRGPTGICRYMAGSRQTCGTRGRPRVSNYAENAAENRHISQCCRQVPVQHKWQWRQVPCGSPRETSSEFAASGRMAERYAANSGGRA